MTEFYWTFILVPRGGDLLQDDRTDGRLTGSVFILLQRPTSRGEERDVTERHGPCVCACVCVRKHTVKRKQYNTGPC